MHYYANLIKYLEIKLLTIVLATIYKIKTATWNNKIQRKLVSLYLDSVAVVNQRRASSIFGVIIE